MLTFLRKIRKTLIDSGSSRKPASPAGRYLIYAIGEIILVVIGILIALQINNWNENKKLLKEESLLLSEMLKNLNSDLSQFENHLEKMESRVYKIEQLYSWLLEEEMIYHDSLNTYFGAVYGVEDINLNAANYEDLKSRGFDLIQDDDLRFQINQFFEESISKVDNYQLSEQAVNEELKPYYLKNFLKIEFRNYAIPIDPEQLFNDTYYQNLVYYRIINLKSNQLKHHPWIIKGMKDLIRNIIGYQNNTS